MPHPDTYSDEDRDRIIAHVVSELASGRSVARILREDDGMPASSQFWRWHWESEDIQAKVARARLHGADAVVDDAIAIADTTEEGETVTEEVGGKDGPRTRRQRGDMIAHRRLRVETRLKYAAMIHPRKYGDKLDLTSDGKAISLSAELDAARRRAAEGMKED